MKAKVERMISATVRIHTSFMKGYIHVKRSSLTPRVQGLGFRVRV